MKASITDFMETPQTPVLQKNLHPLQEAPKAAIAKPKYQKRDNIFSKSRDMREDRGSRQMKTSHNSQTFPHARGHF
jgi:hypothetical protein